MTRRTQIVIAVVASILVVGFVLLWWRASAQAQQIAQGQASDAARREGPTVG